MKTGNFIYQAFFIAILFGTSQQMKSQIHGKQTADTVDQAMLSLHRSMANSAQRLAGAGDKAYCNILMAGPFDIGIQYFYIDTKIPFDGYPAPQIHIKGYNYGHPNRAVSLTLGWYHWAGTWYWTQYQCDLGYYNPSRIRLGTYNDAGTVRVRIEIANDGTYWSSYSFSANDHNGDASCYENWSCHTGSMPSGTGNITTVGEYGYVNIGTAASPATLTVAGDISAREINVAANVGADFVFAPNYRLRPLNEVETFIKDNRHLPDISPADSMVQNGVNMGEMQIRLLQKIEELTLYVIELEKKNEAQQKAYHLEIEALKNEIDKIKDDE